jgi:hypothetical protein
VRAVGRLLRGTGHLVYFVHDLKATRKLCPNLSCPHDGYKMNWKVVTGHALKFSNYYGFGDEAGLGAVNDWTIQPWTKIG